MAYQVIPHSLHLPFSVSQVTARRSPGKEVKHERVGMERLAVVEV